MEKFSSYDLTIIIPVQLEGEATARAIRLAGFVNTPLYVVHVMSIDAMEEIATARRKGLSNFTNSVWFNKVYLMAALIYNYGESFY